MQIKKNLKEYFQREDISERILHYLHQNNIAYEQLTDVDIQNMLQKMQLLEPILTEINQNDNKQQKINQSKMYQNNIDKFQKNQQHIQTKNVLKSNNIISNSKNPILSLVIEGGRKFKILPSMYISVCGFNSRLNTQVFKGKQNIILAQTLQLKMQDVTLKNTKNLELSLISLEEGNKKKIIAIKLIQWRLCLCYGKMSFDIQLAPYESDGINEIKSIGILSLTMSIFPLSKLSMVSQRMLNTQLQLEKTEKQQQNDKYYKCAQQYYKEYKEMNRQFIHRRIQIYANSEDGLLIPVQKTVAPLYKVRGIQSAKHALRWVSLIPFVEEKVEKQICRRFNHMIWGCSVTDHCNLLCSLLLGLGLRSFVCVGQSGSGTHSWVASQHKGLLYFWECTKGLKFEYYSPKTIGFYRAIHLVYNHQEYYANLQKDDSVAACDFHFSDPTLWKKMPLVPTPPYNCQLHLSPSTLDPFQIEHTLEAYLIQSIKTLRMEHKLKFHQDEILSSILTTALTNYELERITGVTICEEEFQNAIKHHIPLKHTFKAFPMQLSTLDPILIFQKFISNETAKNIILTKGEQIQFGLRCKVVVFPQNLFTVWISVAVRYYQNKQK